MTNEVAKAETFEERVFQRMRENIGELMTNEEMKKLLDSALNKMFFQDRILRNSWQQETGRLRPQLYDLVAELLQPMLVKALVEHMAANKEQIEAVVKGVLQGGLVAAYQRALTNATRSAFTELELRLSNLGQEFERSRE